MKNIPVKFRGKDIETGKYVYAELGNIMEERQGYYTFITDDGYTEKAHFVNADSVAQLVGYDANGKEIYEGDVIKNADGDNMLVELMIKQTYQPPTFEVDLTKGND